MDADYSRLWRNDRVEMNDRMATVEDVYDTVGRSSKDNCILGGRKDVYSIARRRGVEDYTEVLHRRANATLHAGSSI